VTRGDPTAHAEMQALRAAMLRLARTDLSGAVLYGTSRACAMCESAAAAAKVARLYHGRDAAGGEAPRAR
jgi:tRNA(Arg) A34 adenosine deaminase TadA